MEFHEFGDFRVGLDFSGGFHGLSPGRRVSRRSPLSSFPWVSSVLQSFFLIVPSYFSFILIVYLLGEVDVVTPILLFFSSAPHHPSVSLTFLWT